MTPDRLREVLSALSWTQRGLADMLGCGHTLVQRMAQGREPIPEPIAAWLERLAVAHAANPMPAWRRPRGPKPVPIP